MKFVEIYPEKQGRPKTEIAYDMESRQLPVAPAQPKTTAILLVDASDGPITKTLPAASVSTNKVYTIKKVDDSGHQVTIQGDDSTETIDGETSVVLKLQYQYVTVHCDGSDWYIIGGEYVKLEDMLEEKLDDINDTLTKLLMQARQDTLHLASLSQEDISEEDVGGE